MPSYSSNPHILNISLSIITVFIGVWVLIIGQAIILPFLIAIFLAVILDPIIIALTKIKIPKGIAVLLTIFILFIVLYLLGLLIYSNVQTFVHQFPAYEDRLVKLPEKILRSIEELSGQVITLEMWKKINWLETIKEFSIAGTVVSGVGTFFTFFGKMLLVFIFMAFMLLGKDNLNNKIRKAFAKNQAMRIEDIIAAATVKIQKYLSTKFLISIITSILAYIIFLVFGLDFAIFWSVVIFIFNFIPNIGSIIASSLPVLFAILQFGSFSIAFYLMLSLAVLQFILGNIIEPRVMGISLDLSPMAVILSLIFWGYIWGIAGMLLSVPILATFVIIFERFDSLKPVSVLLRGKI
jgi:predicted PurR-regulated permease PerM